MIDGKDKEILKILQFNARTPNAEIARQVGMAPSAVLERIRKLENRGVIQGYETRIDPSAVDLGLLAFVYVKTDEAYGSWDVGENLAEIAEVQEVHHIAGEDCYLAKVRANDTGELGRLCREKIGAAGLIRSTQTTIVLGTIKETMTVRLEETEVDAERAPRAQGNGDRSGRARAGKTAKRTS